MKIIFFALLVTYSFFCYANFYGDELIQKLSFHTLSSSGFRTAEILNYGFLGGIVTISSNDEKLNLNDLIIRSRYDWMKFYTDFDGRVDIKMISKPDMLERKNYLDIYNKQGQRLASINFHLDTWLLGTSPHKLGFQEAISFCHALGGELSNHQRFIDMAKFWFGIGGGILTKMHPGSDVFHEDMHSGDVFWVKTSKAVHLHTGLSSSSNKAYALCIHDYNN